MTSLRSQSNRRMTFWRKAASFVLSGVSPTITQREILSPCSELEMSSCLKPLADAFCTSPHKRRCCSGVLTSAPVDDDSNRRHSRSSSIVPVIVSSPPAGASSEISRRASWSFPNDLDTKHGCGEGDRETVVAASTHTMAATAAAEFPVLSRLPPSKDCRCVVLEVGAVGFLHHEHMPPSPALSFNPYISPIKIILFAPD